MLGHPAVREVAVIGVPSERWGEEVKAVVICESDPPVDAETLMAFCGEHLAGYKRPRSVDFVAELLSYPFASDRYQKQVQLVLV